MPCERNMASKFAAEARAAARSAPKRCVFYDLETSYSGPLREGMFKGKKGASRRNLIVEIGAVSLPDRLVFHRLVDPRLKHMDLKNTLETTGQDARRTLKSWTRLFKEKGLLEEDSDGDDMARLDRLFSDRDLFVSSKSAIAHFTRYVYNGSTQCPLIAAHSGCTFDHNVLRHTTMRLKLPQLDAKRMVDTIPVARRCVPGLKSYALGALHRNLFGEGFEMAHHALADVHAMVRVMTHLSQREKIPVHALWGSSRSKNTPLVSLRGVGPKTAAALRAAGYDMTTLRASVLQNKQAPKSIVERVRNHKALWKNLRKQMRVPKHTQHNKTKANVPTPRAQPKRSKRSKSV